MKLSWTLKFGIVFCLDIFFWMAQDISPGEKNFLWREGYPRQKYACKCFISLKEREQKTKFNFPQGASLLRRIGLPRKRIIEGNHSMRSFYRCAFSRYQILSCYLLDVIIVFAPARVHPPAALDKRNNFFFFWNSLLLVSTSTIRHVRIRVGHPTENRKERVIHELLTVYLSI